MKWIVGHSLFLTKEQRDNLLDGHTVEFTGVSVPVFISDGKSITEPAAEVFAIYRLSIGVESFVTLNLHVYVMVITKKQARKIPPIKEGGSDGVYWYCEDGDTVHQVSIRNSESLEKSIVLVQLDQTDSK